MLLYNYNHCMSQLVRSMPSNNLIKECVFIQVCVFEGVRVCVCVCVEVEFRMSGIDLNGKKNFKKSYLYPRPIHPTTFYTIRTI